MSKKEETEQLNMGLKEPFANRLAGVKYNLEVFFVGLRTNSLFSAPFLWVSCALSISFISIQAYYYFGFIDNLPREIPLFLLAHSPEFAIADKNSLFLLLLACILFFVISVIIAVKTFYKFKFVSILIMMNLVISLFLLTISYIKIFGIYIF